MKRRPPRSTRTDTLLPYTTLVRSLHFSLISTQANSRPGLTPGRLECLAPDAEQRRRRQRGDNRADDQEQHDRDDDNDGGVAERSEEHTSELQSLMRISYAVICLQKKIHKHAVYRPILEQKII